MTDASERAGVRSHGAGTAGFRFTGGSVDGARREVRVGGVLQRFEPKVFDVLWHLLERHGRVVTRDELLQRFWPEDSASDGALSRAIMKLRRGFASAERGSEGGIALRTVHRVGYRLDAAALERVDAPGRSAEADLIRVIVGPWRVCTDRPGGEWAEIALITLLVHDLKAMPWMRVEAAPEGWVMNADEAHCLLQGTLSWQDGGWRAACFMTRRAVQVFAGEARGSTLPGLAHDIAAGIASQLQAPASVPSKAGPRDAVEALPMSPRAPYPVDDGHWQHVRSLMLDALEQEEPASEVLDAFARSIADDASSSAWRRASRRLDHEASTGVLGLAAYGHHALAYARINGSGADAQAEFHLREASRLARQSGQRALEFHAQVTLANLDIQRGHVAGGRSRYEELLSSVDSAQHPAQSAKMLNNLGILDAMEGNLIGAHSRFERALRLCRREGVEPIYVATASNLAMVEVDLACIDDAVETVEGLLELLPRVQPPRLAADIALTACRVFAEAAAAGRMQEVLRLFSSWAPAQHRPVQIRSLLATSLYRAACGENHAALESVRRAVLLAMESQERLNLAEWIGMWVRAALRADDAASVREALAIARTLQPVDDGLEAGGLHASAAACHAKGRPQEARAHLAGALERLRPGALASRVRHDAAWVCAEMGVPAEGESLLRDLPNWREGHPLGWKVRARLLSAQGDAPGAAHWQERLVDRLGPCASPFDHQLLQAYRGASTRRIDVPVAPSLPSLMMPSL